MLPMDIRKYAKVIYAVLAVIAVMCVGIYFCVFYKLGEKTDRIYSAAIEDYEKGDWQNSYYLFSKVSHFSPLKPMAVYHRGDCARMLDDKKSAIKQYTFLFKHYPKHKLSIRSKYMAAQELVNVNPEKSQKYFKSIIKSEPHSDYAIASEYYLGKIILDKFTDKDGKFIREFPKSKKIEAEKYFRHYITKAPAGKHALNAVNAWLNLNVEISPDDYLLMARTAYLFADYDKTLELLKNVPQSDSWALYVKTYKAKGDFDKVKTYAVDGVKNYSTNVSSEEFEDAVYLYINTQTKKLSALEELLNLSPKSGTDYITNLKCEMLSQTDIEACYNSLYLLNGKGKYAPKALSQIFISKVKKHDYTVAQKIGQDYLNKFPSSEYEPMILFWLGKIEENNGYFQESTRFYNNVIMKYPDTYWAYRSYLRINRLNTNLVKSTINQKPVEFPYRYGDKKLIENLVRLKDYEMVELISGGDEFIKSWVLYNRGDLSNSAIVAREAMAKLDKKPDKYDLRWRLVYPINYWDLVKHYGEQVANNIPLMLAIVREESYFDPLAQSTVGASGLMQLMPSTASSIAKSYGINDEIDLFNPEINIMLGNYYYAQLRTMANGSDITSVVAYNGGIGNVNAWKNSISYADIDEFVEKIPYFETQEYVKKVFRSYWNYIRIYDNN